MLRLTKEEYAEEPDQPVKLARTEYGFTQGKMAKVPGLSKKALAEIEKNRSSLGWIGAVALCTLFSWRRVPAGLPGGEAGGLIHAPAFSGAERRRPHHPKAFAGHF